MKLLSLLALLLFLTTVTGEVNISDFDDEEDEADMEDLDPDDPTEGLIGDRCGRSNPCARGLDCIRVPLRKRCYPVTCGVSAVRSALAQTGFDLGSYGRDLLGFAKVNRTTTNMFRAFPDRKMNMVRTESDDFKRMTTAIQENQPPVDLIVEYFNNCTGGVDTMSRASTAGLTPYFGASWELGLLGTYNADIFWGQGRQFKLYCCIHACITVLTTKIACVLYFANHSVFSILTGTADPIGVGLLNNCFGAVLGYDAGISGLLGLAFTGAISDLSEGCKQVFPIAEFPPFGLQLGFINDDIPTFLMEFNGGASASVGLPGYTSCTTTLL